MDTARVAPDMDTDDGGLEISSARFEGDAGHSSTMHSHAQGQITYVMHGVISIETASGVWVAPKGCLAWIPPGLPHASRSRGAVAGWLVLLARHAAKRLPGQPGVLKASPLLIAALDRLRQLDETDPALRQPLSRIVHLELERSEPEPFGLPLPTSARLKDWALRFLAAPDVNVSIDSVAAAVGQARRTFTRHFERQVGQTFAGWKRAVVVQHAIERLVAGDSVSAIAFDVGYESPSAFVAMFRSVRGLPPKAFMQSLLPELAGPAAPAGSPAASA